MVVAVWNFYQFCLSFVSINLSNLLKFRNDSVLTIWILSPCSSLASVSSVTLVFRQEGLDSKIREILQKYNSDDCNRLPPDNDQVLEHMMRIIPNLDREEILKVTSPSCWPLFMSFIPSFSPVQVMTELFFGVSFHSVHVLMTNVHRLTCSLLNQLTVVILVGSCLHYLSGGVASFPFYDELWQGVIQLIKMK